MRVRNRYLVKWAAYLFAWCCRLIFLTVRVERRHLGEDPLPEHDRNERFVLALWHEWAVLPLFGVSTDKLAVLTSRHVDGDFVTATLKVVGVDTIRGSTSRGGAEAVRQMLRRAAESHLAITPDGPRGPRRQMSPGLAYVAARSGRRILASGYACGRCWRIPGGWTDLVIPKPFSRVIMITSAPITVPTDVAVGQLDEVIHQLQAAMDHTDQLAKETLAAPRRSAGRFTRAWRSAA